MNTTTAWGIVAGWVIGMAILGFAHAYEAAQEPYQTCEWLIICKPD